MSLPNTPKPSAPQATSRANPDSPIDATESASSTIEIDLEDPGRDPRNICVLDHPGRHAQYKHWLQAGLLDEAGSKRLTLKEAQSRPGVAVPARPRRVAEDWSRRCVLSGGVVTGNFRGSFLSDSGVGNFLIWIQELLTSWNVTEISPKKISTVFVTISSTPARPLATVLADFDFSANPELSPDGLLQISRFLAAYPRLRIRTLRLDSLNLTDLAAAADLPYLRRLEISSNNLTSEVLVDFVNRQTQLRINTAKTHSVSEKDFASLGFHLPLFVTLWDNFADAALLRDLSALSPCLVESTGCEPAALCRRLGEKFKVHLSGFCRQRRPGNSN